MVFYDSVSLLKDMASTLSLTLFTSSSSSSHSYHPHTKHGFGFAYPRIKLFPSNSKHRVFSVSASASSSSLQALIFDCDGVILESEHLHRQAYNDAFAHFNVRCPSSSSDQPLNWGIHFYDELQNRIGGGKPKMRWFFCFYPSNLQKFWSLPVLFCSVVGVCLCYVLCCALFRLGDFKVL